MKFCPHCGYERWQHSKDGSCPYDPEVYELAKSVAEEADIKPTSYRHEDRRFVEKLAQMLQDIIEQEITDYCEQREGYIAAKRAGEDV